MRFSAFATDYDGTIATHGQVPAAVMDALGRLKQSGWKLLLVTGRETDDIVQTFREMSVFDRVVSENGAVIYRPLDGSERLLAERPAENFVAALRRRRVWPLGVGRVVIGTARDQTAKVQRAMEEAGADARIIFNKRSVMVLPRGVDKTTGLLAALDELGLSTDGLIAVGDGENDIPMLEMAARGVAVAGAMKAVKQAADAILQSDAGNGVIELIEKLLLAEEMSGDAAAMAAGAMLEHIDRLPDSEDHFSGAHRDR